MTRDNDSVLTDREFFNAYPDQDIRRRPIVPGELPRSMVGRKIREVEVRNVCPDIHLLRFIDAAGGRPLMLPVFETDLFLTSDGRQKIVACLNMMDGFSSFILSCARYETEDEQNQ
jgi:hypothetical protein